MNDLIRRLTARWLPLERIPEIQRYYKHPVIWKCLRLPLKNWAIIIAYGDPTRRLPDIPPSEPGERWIRPVVKPGDYAVPKRYEVIKPTGEGTPVLPWDEP